jgi:hypothetical protein
MRLTNRNIQQKQPIEELVLNKLKDVAKTIQGSQLLLFDKEQELSSLAEIVGKVEQMRFLHKESYLDLMNEIRWTEKEAVLSRNGIDLRTVDMTDGEVAGLTILKDPLAVEYLNKWKLGSSLSKVSKKSIAAASALGLIVMPSNKPSDFYNGGRALQRVWLEANRRGISLQPISPSVFYFVRLLDNSETSLSSRHIEELKQLKIKFDKIKNTALNEIFLFRLCIADAPDVKSLRYPITEILIS